MVGPLLLQLHAKTCADRLHPPLEYISSNMQSVFIEGHTIVENVLYRIWLVECLHDFQHPAWLFITDLASAYDNVDRQFLLGCRHMPS